MDLVQALKENPFVLAPMAAITDNAFRSFMKEMGCSIVVSELISSDGIKYDNQKTLRMLQFDPAQKPVGLQIFGDDPKIMSEAARKIEALGASFVDLNFGCPVKKVVQKGAGSAILKDLRSVQVMITEIKKSISIPLTIKIRTGWDANSRNADEVCNIAYNEGVSWVTIHGRTRAQDYEGQADWDYIAEVKSKTKIAIIGNGDIVTPESAVQKLSQYNVDGVMIGRGALKNPWIFQESYALWKGHDGVFTRSFSQAFERLKYYLELNFPPMVVSIQLRKFAGWFSAGYPGGADFRRSMFQLKEPQEILLHTLQYFHAVEKIRQGDTSRERFLMGGHG